jgi:arylsulfatase A-like enzyme/Tfp pilus assembly protein PilF
VLLGVGLLVLAGAAAFHFRPKARRDLLLITLDTTRADRLGCYGHSAANTPVLDALAESGILCENAYTVAPLTLPAHASLFTALYPAEHGIRTNGRGRLGDSVPTLAEALKRQGYDTGAFVGSFVLNRKFGLDRGFIVYDDDFASDEPAPDALHRERRGQSVVDKALAWLARSRTGPFFCWVHLYDPHAPYLAHSDLFGDQFADRPYDAEIAYVDRQVGRLIDYLKTSGREPETLVVVVGDHGEGLGDHVERRHGSTLYNETLRVPLVFRLPKRLAAGIRVASTLSLIDISPTVLDLLDIGDPRIVTGQSMRSGLAAGTFPSRACLAATDEPFLNNGCAPLRSLTDGRWKYIRSTRPELYDLKDDPHERRNLAESDVNRLNELESRLVGFESRLVAHDAREVQLSSAERRAIESLGYAGHARVGASQAAVHTDLPDVKDLLEVDVGVEDAREMIAQSEMEMAIERLRALVRQAPSHLDANWALAGALQATNRLDEAEEVLRSFLAINPDSRQAHYGLGLVLTDRGREDLARREFLKVLDIDPEFADAHLSLAKALGLAGRAREALTHLSAVLEIDPQCADAYHWRANLLVGLGEADDAFADYRQALKYAPDAADVHHNFGRVLAEKGDFAGAREHLMRAVELNPESAEIEYALGAFLLAQHEPDAAIEHLTRALKLKPDLQSAREQLQSAQRAAETAGPSRSN